MTRPKLSDRRIWVFDLDNTLYDPSARLFDQIEERMTEYVSNALGVSRSDADRLRRDYWLKYGTTLAGLMEEHDLDPDPYLVDVHDIKFDQLQTDPDLRAAVQALLGRKIVYTNGSAPYAERVLQARGLGDLFDAVYGVEHAGYRPKPHPSAFAAVFERDSVEAGEAVMFEDDPRNLEVPHALGLATVHVAPSEEKADHIHYHTADLAGFLRAVYE